MRGLQRRLDLLRSKRPLTRSYFSDPGSGKMRYGSSENSAANRSMFATAGVSSFSHCSNVTKLVSMPEDETF